MWLKLKNNVHIKILLHANIRARKAALVRNYFTRRNNFRLNCSCLPSLSHSVIFDQIKTYVLFRRVKYIYQATFTCPIVFLYPVSIKMRYKTRSKIYWSIHMVELLQHLQKIGAIAANGEKSKISWYGLLNNRSTYRRQLFAYSPEDLWEAIQSWHLTPKIWIPSLWEKKKRTNVTSHTDYIVLQCVCVTLHPHLFSWVHLGETVLEHVIWGTDGKWFKASTHRTSFQNTDHFTTAQSAAWQ